MRHFCIKIWQCAAVTGHRGWRGGVEGGAITVFKVHHVSLSRFKWARRSGHKWRGGAGGAAGGQRRRTQDGRGAEVSVKNAAAPPFPSQPLVPHPCQLSAAVAGGGRTHSLRTRRARRRGGRRRQCAEGRRRWRGGGGLGRLTTQGKLGTSISNGKRPSGSAADAHGPRSVPSSPARKRYPIPGLGRCGRCRPLRRPHPSSFARLHRGTHPSLPCEWRRATTRIRPLGLLAAGALGGGSGRRSGPRDRTGGCTRPTRRHCAQTAWVRP